MNIKNTLLHLQEIGLTQAQIAHELGCSQSYVSQVISGKYGSKRPTYKLICSIETMLHRYKDQLNKNHL